MSYPGFMEHDCYLQTRASSQNAFREWVYTYATSATKTKCRFSPLSAMERIEPTGKYDDVTYKVGFEYDSSVERDSRLIYNNHTYRVKEVLVDSNAHHRTAFVVQLE